MSVTATGLTPRGVELQVVMNAANTNDAPLTARAVNARVTLNKTIDLGTVVSTQPIAFPSRKTVPITVPLSVKWTSVAPLLLQVAASPDDVGYAVDGTVTMGEALMDVTVPFHLEGVLTHDQIAQAVPGLPRAR